ncbi:MAG TPA: N-formylglutamate amidohydrolase, partial [Xanthobacteraceae bacterium]|nr:N-formylglutamate amidohydrolase [Xanthobacteraceae bacterium]
MSARIVQELDPAFEVTEPKILGGPVVCNSPHSGRSYPADFLTMSRLDLPSLRRSEDTFVDELFADAVRHGAPLMRAHFPRAFLDVNREPYELDPRMFDGRLPAFANTRSLRVAGGLGTIARVVGDAREIYDRRLP